MTFKVNREAKSVMDEGRGVTIRESDRHYDAGDFEFIYQDAWFNFEFPAILDRKAVMVNMGGKLKEASKGIGLVVSQQWLLDVVNRTGSRGPDSVEELERIKANIAQGLEAYFGESRASPGLPRYPVRFN